MPWRSTVPRASRRPPQPRPQTQRCRFVDRDNLRCRRLATVSSFCTTHVQQLEQQLHQPDGLGDIFTGALDLGNAIDGMFQRLGREFGQLATAQMERLTGRARPAAPMPGPSPTGATPPPRPDAPPRPRVTPEAIERRKRYLAACGTLGLDPDRPLTEAEVKRARHDLVRVFHTDRDQADPTRQEHMRKINAAADLLLATVRARTKPAG